MVSVCGDPTSCNEKLRTNHYDVVLADAKDARPLKSSFAGSATPSTVVPLMLNAPKDEFKSTKQEFGSAFDASGGSLRLLPVLDKVAREQSKSSKP